MYCRQRLKDYLLLLSELTLLFVCLWLLTDWFQQHVRPISRRMVNISYILWMVRSGTNHKLL